MISSRLQVFTAPFLAGNFTNKNNQSSIDGGNLWQKFEKRGYRFDFEIYDELSHNWNDAEIDIDLS
ncbi:MAG: hypothetical protein JJU13_02680 [Balneolaceae bacterium]|nr:hypothetical protein [Balneolaceae bacterium]